MRQLEFFFCDPRKYRPQEPQEWKLVAVRECPTPDRLKECNTPDDAAAYWRLHVVGHPYFNPDVECFVVLLLTTRKRIKGHYLVSLGTLNTVLVHSREVFRIAIHSAAFAVVLMHNHPSGDPDPSEGDLRVTRDMIRAGEILKIEVVDHIIMGNPQIVSLKSRGFFHS